MGKKICFRKRMQVFSKYNGKCAYCGCVLDENMHIDHIIPLKTLNGGDFSFSKNDIENLNPSCPKCNMVKGTKSIDEFRFAKKKREMIDELKDFFNTEEFINTVRNENRFYFETITP